jgi:hypothetical protein
MAGKSLLLTLVLFAVLAPAAYAQDSNADCRNLDDPVFSGWTSYAQLGTALDRIERTSRNRVEVDVIGHTARGRNLYAARVGSGDRVMLVTSAIHGNEKTGTEALLHWLQHIGSSQTAETKALLEGITFVAVPMINPDGGELNRRQNDLPWSEVVETSHSSPALSPPGTTAAARPDSTSTATSTRISRTSRGRRTSRARMPCPAST